MDLRTTLAQSQCWLSGFSGAPYEACGIPLPAGPYNYPPAAFLMASRLGLTLENLNAVGACLVILWTLAAIAFLWVVSRHFAWPAIVLTALVLASPGASLMLERGSNESLVWMLSAGAMSAFWYRRWWLPSILVSLAILLKFFPVGLATLFLLPLPKRGRGKSRWVIVLPIVAASVTLPFIIWQSGRVPRPIGDAFGAVTFVHFAQAGIAWLRGESSLLDYPESRVTTSAVILAGMLFLALVAAVWAVVRRWKWVLGASDVRQWSVVSTAATVILVYLSGTSYDYRLVVLAFAIAPLWLMMRLQKAGGPRTLVTVVLICLSASTWLSIPWPRPIQVVGDVCLLVGVIGLAVLALLLVLAPGAPLSSRAPVAPQAT